MYVDSIKIGNTNARAIRTVVDLEAVPTQVFENSPMLIKVGETLYVKNKVVGTIIGTWHLKDTISYATNVGVNFDFVSNDTTYTALLWQNSELHYASQATSDVVVYNSSGWVNQAYRTIVIKSGENADLLAFLQASAEKLIDGYYYYSQVGGGSDLYYEKIEYITVVPVNAEDLVYLGGYTEKPSKSFILIFDVSYLRNDTTITARNEQIEIIGYEEFEDGGLPIVRCLLRDDYITLTNSVDAQHNVEYTEKCYVDCVWLSSSTAEALGFSTGVGFYISLDKNVYNYQTQQISVQVNDDDTIDLTIN